MKDGIEAVFYTYLYGDWDSLTHWAWIYMHIAIFLATMGIGFAFAHGEHLLTIALLPFPIIYLYKRHEKTKMYKNRLNEQN